MKHLIVSLLLAIVLLGIIVTDSCAGSIILPASLTTIESEAFAGDAIDTLSLPARLKRIENKAFANCDMKNVIIPSLVSYIAEDAFAGNPNLHIIAEPGTYAYTWAKEKGFITNNPYIFLPKTDITVSTDNYVDFSLYYVMADTSDLTVTEYGIDIDGEYYYASPTDPYYGYQRGYDIRGGEFSIGNHTIDAWVQCDSYEDRMVLASATLRVKEGKQVTITAEIDEQDIVLESGSSVTLPFLVSSSNTTLRHIDIWASSENDYVQLYWNYFQGSTDNYSDSLQINYDQFSSDGAYTIYFEAQAVNGTKIEKQIALQVGENIDNTCSHENTHVEYDDMIDEEARAIDQHYHIRKYTYRKYVFCDDCGECISEEIEKEFSTVERHTSGRYDGICGFCFGEYTCEHEQTIEETEIAQDSRIDNGDGTHTLTVYTHLACAFCGYYLGTQGSNTITEAHDFTDGGNCQYCGAINPEPCSHIDTEIVYKQRPTYIEESAGHWPELVDENTHKRYEYVEKETVCRTCGYVLDTEYDDSPYVVIIEDHVYDQITGECKVCGYAPVGDKAGVPTIISPITGSTVYLPRITVTWQPAENAARYVCFLYKEISHMYRPVASVDVGALCTATLDLTGIFSINDFEDLENGDYSLSSDFKIMVAAVPADTELYSSRVGWSECRLALSGLECEHTSSTWVKGADPTEDEEGYDKLVCDRCGVTIDWRTIEPLSGGSSLAVTINAETPIVLTDSFTVPFDVIAEGSRINAIYYDSEEAGIEVNEIYWYNDGQVELYEYHDSFTLNRTMFPSEGIYSIYLYTYLADGSESIREIQVEVSA